MKKLFLSSYFSQVAKLLLPLLPKSPKKLKLAFIPTAADPYTDKSWMYADRNKLIEMGFHVTDVDIKNQTKEKLYEKFKEIDVIFVSGGNVYYLLEKAKQSGFNEIVKDLVNKGMIYVSSSAGSVLLCPTIEFIEDLDDKNKAQLNSYNSINLIDFLILLHYGEPKYKDRHKKIIDKWSTKGYKIKTLTNNQVLIVDNNKIEIISTEGCKD